MMSSTVGDVEVETHSSTLTEVPWSVVVWDDPITPMTVVTAILQRIFGYAHEKANELMLKVHNEGRAIVWSGNSELAVSFCTKLQAHGLLSTVEQAGT